MYPKPSPYPYQSSQEIGPEESSFPIQSQISVLQFIGFALLVGCFASPFAMVYKDGRLATVYYFFEIDFGIVFLLLGLLAAFFSLYGLLRLTITSTILTIAAAIFFFNIFDRYVPLTELMHYQRVTNSNYYPNNRAPVRGWPYSSYQEVKTIEVKKIPVNVSISFIWMIALTLNQTAFLSSAFLKRKLDRESFG